MSMGVRMACVKEQQTAPARAYREYRPMGESICDDDSVVIGGCDGLNVASWDMARTAATRDEDDEGEDDPFMLYKVLMPKANIKVSFSCSLLYLHPASPPPSDPRIPLFFSALGAAAAASLEALDPGSVASVAVPLIDSKTRTCSFFRASKSSSSRLCHGYRTHT